MDYIKFLQLSCAFFLLPFLPSQAQNAEQFSENINFATSEINSTIADTKSDDDGVIFNLRSDRIMMSFDGSVSHRHFDFGHLNKMSIITYQFGYRINEKSIIGIGIQLEDETNYFQIFDDNGLGTKYRNLNQKQFEPFFRRYFRTKSKFQLYSQLGLEISIDDFNESRSYANSEDRFFDKDLSAVTFGANLGLGVEYHIKDDLSLFTQWDAFNFARDVRFEESTSQNMELEYNLDTRTFRDLRFGIKFFF